MTVQERQQKTLEGNVTLKPLGFDTPFNLNGNACSVNGKLALMTPEFKVYTANPEKHKRYEFQRKELFEKLHIDTVSAFETYTENLHTATISINEIKTALKGLRNKFVIKIGNDFYDFKLINEFVKFSNGKTIQVFWDGYEYSKLYMKYDNKYFGIVMPLMRICKGIPTKYNVAVDESGTTIYAEAIS